MEKNLIRRILSMALSIAMVFSMLPTALAAEDTCEHHIHDESCGYSEGTSGSDCTHSHDEACGYTESVEGSCTHTHDETCGYSEAVPGTPCGYVCEACAGEVAAYAAPVVAEDTSIYYDNSASGWAQVFVNWANPQTNANEVKEIFDTDGDGLYEALIYGQTPSASFGPSSDLTEHPLWLGMGGEAIVAGEVYRYVPETSEEEEPTIPSGPVVAEDTTIYYDNSASGWAQVFVNWANPQTNANEVKEIFDTDGDGLYEALIYGQTPSASFGPSSDLTEHPLWLGMGGEAIVAGDVYRYVPETAEEEEPTTPSGPVVAEDTTIYYDNSASGWAQVFVNWANPQTNANEVKEIFDTDGDGLYEALIYGKTPSASFGPSSDLTEHPLWLGMGGEAIVAGDVYRYVPETAEEEEPTTPSGPVVAEDTTIYYDNSASGWAQVFVNWANPQTNANEVKEIFDTDGDGLYEALIYGQTPSASFGPSSDLTEHPLWLGMGGEAIVAGGTYRYVPETSEEEDPTTPSGPVVAEDTTIYYDNSASGWTQVFVNWANPQTNANEVKEIFDTDGDGLYEALIYGQTPSASFGPSSDLTEHPLWLGMGGEAIVAGGTYRYVPETEEPEIPENGVTVIVPEDFPNMEAAQELAENTAVADFAVELPDGVTLVIEIQEIASESETLTLTFDVTPEDAEGNQASLDEPITFRLPLPASVTESYAKIYHEGEYLETVPVNEESGAKYVEITAQNFSAYSVEPVNHNYSASVTAPTCEEQGYTTYTCSRCGDSYVDNYVDALDHDMGNWVIDQAATCTAPGSKHKDCSRCDYSETETIAATGHSYSEVITAPTCEEQGYTTHTCSACSDSYVDSYVNALGHDMGNWVIDQAATCTAPGSKHKDCSRCDYSETETIAATGHSYSEVITAPTCEEQGYTTYTCSACSDSYVDSYVNALGHDMGNWVIDQAATCTAPGSKHKDCSRCDYSETETIAATGHSYSEVITAPTCEEQGYTTHTCSACSDSYVDSYVNVLGHTEVIDVPVAPTCTATGLTEGKHCSVCGEVLIAQTVIPAKGHTEVVDKKVEATCTDTGLTEGKHCAVCAETISAQEIIPALGHKAETIPGSDATCTEPGLTDGSKCSVCGEILATQEVIPATGHGYSEVVTAPTCEEEGYTTYTCGCGDSYVDDHVPALGHDMGPWTAIDEEMEQRQCSRCDHTQTRRIGGNILVLSDEEFANHDTVWIDGQPVSVEGEGEERYVDLPTGEETMLVAYTWHIGDEADIHTKYPTGMKVYRIVGDENGFTAEYIPELDNLLQYSGASIRIVGVKGIRMITSITKGNKSALTGAGLAGYTLEEYGTALCWATDLAPGEDLVLGKEYTRSNYAYKKGVADPIFAQTADLIQYTNVLVGFSDDQCIPDIVMRPYIILSDAEGNQVTLYGGSIHRSIGYIAYQNRNVFQPGNASYDYVWGIIHHVYGDQFDEDYKG